MKCQCPNCREMTGFPSWPCMETKCVHCNEELEVRAALFPPNATYLERKGSPVLYAMGRHGSVDWSQWRLPKERGIQ